MDRPVRVFFSFVLHSLHSGYLVEYSVLQASISLWWLVKSPLVYVSSCHSDKPRPDALETEGFAGTRRPRLAPREDHDYWKILENIEQKDKKRSTSAFLSTASNIQMMFTLFYQISPPGTSARCPAPDAQRPMPVIHATYPRLFHNQTPCRATNSFPFHSQLYAISHAHDL
jgi:hypothetical protein